MARKNLGWFEFKGASSADMGVSIVSASAFASGARRGSEEHVSGRNGYIWLSDETREQYDLKRTCRVRSSKLRDVRAWLSGSGRLRFSAEPDAQYDARIISKIDFKQVCPGEDPLYEFSAVFTCNPDPYIYPAADDFDATTSGEEFPAPQNAYALPKITIVANGTFSITIGMQTVFFRGVDDGIIVDSELGDALTLDGAQLANEKMDGELFRLDPSFNTVSWIAGGEDDEGNPIAGNVERVTITPRWRYM